MRDEHGGPPRHARAAELAGSGPQAGFLTHINDIAAGRSDTAFQSRRERAWMEDDMNDKSSGFLPSLWSEGPFVEFRKEMDSALESFFGRHTSKTDGKGFDKFLSPSIDVVENDTAIVLTAELPGMTEQDFDLSTQSGMLLLRGEKKMEKKDDKDDFHLVERRYGRFERTMPVPPNVDEEAISAKFDKGVLTVTMPKKPGTKPAERKIAIAQK
ncbi:MAG TPA: Hsp20/alpha crystallin family protein [Devosia sp.]|nr:Hsp20/alpha crystallin family protein [Devosia sp.]